MVVPFSRRIPLLAAALALLLAVAAPAAHAGSLLTAPLAAPSLAPATAPVNTATPWIGGTIATGQTLTTSLGVWTQSPTAYAYQWQRDAGSGFADVTGATTSTYALTAADTGTDLRVVVTATNSIGSTAAISPSVGPVDAALPTNGVLPAITGTAQRGQTLVASPGTWNPAGTSYAYQWQRDAGSGFADVTGATSSTFVLTSTDVGATLRVIVTATNTYGNATATSRATTTVQPLLPASTSTPTISGTLKRTFTLAATSGTWSPAGATIAYQWQRDTGSGFAAISGATSSTYTLAAADVGARVRIAVTATNADGSTTATSAASATVLGNVPVVSTSPAITGDNKAGETLTASPGSWSPAATSYGYQWQRDGGSGFTDISGATADTYVVATADAGSRLRVVVTATNAEGSGSASSAATSVVTNPPVFTTAPATPTGTLMDTYVLTADPGVWTPSNASATYQWVRCPVGATAPSASCTPVGANGTYRLTAQDVGHPMAVRVTASYSLGSTAAYSPLTAAVDGRPLTAVTAPAVAGTVEVAGIATVTPATWSVPTTTVKYQWQRCAADGTGCADIPGATGDRYSIGLDDAAHQLAVTAIATSPGRTATSTSTPVTVADQPLPTATVLPRISGQARRTGTLNASAGTWASKPTKYAFQWQRCDADGTNCVDISGARGPSVLLGVPDVGKAITVVVSATNTSGTVTAAAAPTAPIAAVPPILRRTPWITGILQVPSTIQVIGSNWETTADTKYTNQWLRCDTAGANCVAIAGATKQTYKLSADDAGQTLRVEQTATNPDGSVTGTTPPSGVIKPPKPSVGTYPRLAISGVPAQVGRVLTFTAATWFNTDSTVVQFWRCAPRCVPLSTGGALTYTLVDADAGAILRASEKATGPGGTTTVYASSYYGPVRSAAAATALLSGGTTAKVRTASGMALATASLSTKATARAALATGSRARVTLRRVRGVRGGLRAWVCATPVPAGQQEPCSAARSLRSRATLTVAVARGQHVRVVVVRR